MRSGLFRKAIKSEPTLLVRAGQMLRDAMRQERVVPADIFQAIRGEGMEGLEDVRALILETDGSMSVISNQVQEIPPSNRLCPGRRMKGKEAEIEDLPSACQKKTYMQIGVH
ncbi:MAG: YetF domain-containing protein [Phycisphaerae bacterium]